MADSDRRRRSKDVSQRSDDTCALRWPLYAYKRRVGEGRGQRPTSSRSHRSYVHLRTVRTWSPSSGKKGWGLEDVKGVGGRRKRGGWKT